MIYFDNASTSFPKPSEVIHSIQDYLCHYGVTPGRGSHDLSEKCEELVIDTRERLNAFIQGSNKDHVIFTGNATHSLNLIIQGFLKQNDHALICSYSHNSVIRPIEKLKREGIISYDMFEIDTYGNIDPLEFKNKLKPNTTLVILNHASNVLGIIADFLPIALICQEAGIRFLLDCTQSLGYAPIDFSNMPIDFLCGTGHKTLLGPSGVGFACIKNPKLVDHMMVGGSGANHSFSTYHPSQMPHRFEAGTLNTTAIAGLNGSLKYIEKMDQKEIVKQSLSVAEYAWEQLSKLEEIQLYGTSDFKKKVPIISFNIRNTLATEAGFLYNSKNICLRIGLHCAPFIHKTLQTLPVGTIRISFGHLNTFEEVDKLIETTQDIIMETRHGKTCA